MKMRQIKRARLSTMLYSMYLPVSEKYMAWCDSMAETMCLPTISQEVAGGPVTVYEDEPTPLVEAFRQGIAEQAAKYVVQRVKDNEIVSEFDTREEALALVLKHARQKKAKLFATQNGEPVLFSEAEFA